MFSSHRLATLLRRSHAEHLKSLGRARGSDAIAEAAKALTYERKSEAAADEALASGGVVTSVANESEVESVPYWLQADPSLYSVNNLRRRFALRHHTLVLSALAAWWEAALHTLVEWQMPADARGFRGVARGGYDAILRRIFRVMLPLFDEDEVLRNLEDDWREDSKGEAKLSRAQFCDAIFQLADIWTTGVTPEEYASFLWTLLERVAKREACGCPGECQRRLKTTALFEEKNRKNRAQAMMGSPSFFYLDESELHFHPDYAPNDDDEEEDDDKEAKRAAPPPMPRRSKKNAETKELAFSALSIQQNARRRSSRRRANERRGAAVVMQKNVRARKARKKTTKKKVAIVTVQKDWRMFVKKRNYWTLLHAVLKFKLGEQKRREEEVSPAEPRRKSLVGKIISGGGSSSTRNSSRSSARDNARSSETETESMGEPIRDLLTRELSQLKTELADMALNGHRRDNAIGAILEKVEKQERRMASSPHGGNGNGGGGGASPEPSSQLSPEGKRIWGHEMRKVEEPAANLDVDIISLLQSDLQLRELLTKLKAQRQASSEFYSRGEAASSWWQPKISPDATFRTVWTVMLGTMLTFTCYVVPLRIAFPTLFKGAHEASWNGVNIMIEWFFFCDLVLNFFTGFYNREGALDYRLHSIARHYIRGWFWVDFTSALPLDTIALLTQSELSIVLRLNKVLRVARLAKVMGLLRVNKRVRRFVDPGAMKLFQLILFLLLAWHYAGCFWWAIGDAYGRPIVERLRVLEPQLTCGCEGGGGGGGVGGGAGGCAAVLECDDATAEGAALFGFATCYLSAFYWAVLMSTGLNVVITPGLRAGLVFYECLVSFLGVCLQAYMLGATASEIANMDAQDTKRRQKLVEIKQHLRTLRVPRYLREPITEYYERETFTTFNAEDYGPLTDMPPTLKVQLAVTLNAEFLRKVPFFSSLDGTVTAALVISMRSRVCLPHEVVIHEGDTSPALYFIRGGRVEVLKLSGPVGLMPELGGDPLGKTIATLREHACFGEQSFLSSMPSLATIRSTGYSTLGLIHRSDFEAIQEMFPQLRVHVMGFRKEAIRDYHSQQSQKAAGSQRHSATSVQQAWANATVAAVSFTNRMKSLGRKSKEGQQGDSVVVPVDE